jgi:hypothetical protein
MGGACLDAGPPHGGFTNRTDGLGKRELTKVSNWPTASPTHTGMRAKRSYRRFKEYDALQWRAASPSFPLADQSA